MLRVLSKRSLRRSPYGARRATPLFRQDNQDEGLLLDDILPDSLARLVMAFTIFPIALTPKPATALGKFEWEPFILAIAKQSTIGVAKPFGLVKPFGLMKQEGMALVVGAIEGNKPNFGFRPSENPW